MIHSSEIGSGAAHIAAHRQIPLERGHQLHSLLEWHRIGTNISDGQRSLAMPGDI
jgi:hypothetical protein